MHLCITLHLSSVFMPDNPIPKATQKLSNAVHGLSHKLIDNRS